jgi:S1-C subfamily serine protease
MPLFSLFIYCLFLLLPGIDAHAQDETPLQLLQTVKTSLVEIRCTTTKTVTDNTGDTKFGTYQAQGSGVIIDSNGLIVTNTHIIANAQHILVGLSDGKILEAKLVYSSDADFSFIKIDPPYPLDAITWADSAQALVGTSIIALTNADDDGQHVVGGEITSLVDGISSDDVEMLELNLNLIPGDSGGPLLDNQGHLLGLIMARKNNEDNKTYAIASNKIQKEYMHYQQHLPA